MPTATFSLDDVLYRELVKRGKQKGLSPHQVAKEIVENHLLNYSSDVNIPHKYPIFTSEINIANKYPIYSSELNIGNKAQTYSSEINIANKVSNKVNSPVSTGDSPVNTVTDGFGQSNEVLLKELDKRLRRLEDLINAYTGKSDQVLQRLSQLVEAFETLSEKLDRVAEALSKQQVLERAEEKLKPSEAEKQGKGAKREKTTVCEVLDKQLVLFESEIADKIRNRDAFFSAIESKCNGIVIEGARERVAVEKSFWQSFLSKVSKISTSDDKEIKRELDALEYRLFKTLKESALLIYDTTKKQCVFVEQKGTSSTTASSASTSGKQHYRKRYEDDESWVLQYVDNE